MTFGLLFSFRFKSSNAGATLAAEGPFKNLQIASQFFCRPQVTGTANTEHSKIDRKTSPAVVYF